MLKTYYKQGAIIFFNTLLFLLIINLAGYIFYAYKDKNPGRYENQITLKYGKEAVSKAYPHLSYGEINQLLAETWNRPLQYDYYTGFREKPFKGRYVNIDAAGFRKSKHQAPWPIDSNKYNIFVFGGSTTFGYGVADQETIPSYLQQLLAKREGKEVAIYNFGTAFYYSVQEKLLLEQLMYQGQHPDLAIFIDGLNDAGVFEAPAYATQMQQLYAGGPGFFFQKWVSLLPLVRMVTALRSRILPVPETHIPDYCAASHLARCYQRYRQTKGLVAAIARPGQVKTLFVWQPSSRYNYFPAQDLFKVGHDKNPNSQDCTYLYFLKYLAELKKDGDFIWLADIQKNKRQNLYVDKVHYSRDLNFMIADTLAAYLSARLRPR
jgi:hypothetical protein